MYCVLQFYADLFAFSSHFSIGYGPILLKSREINLGGGRRKPDQIGGVLKMFQAFGGVLVVWSTFGSPWSILGHLDQRGGRI